MEKVERFLLCAIAIWFSVISIIILASLWNGPVIIHETNKALLAFEVCIASLIGLFGFLAYVRFMRSVVRTGRPRQPARPALSQRLQNKKSLSSDWGASNWASTTRKA